MMRIWVLTVVFLHIVRAAAPLGNIYGTVTDNRTGKPVSGCLVRLSPSAAEAETEAAGAFHLDSIPTGSYRVTFLAPGYHSRTVDNVIVTSGMAEEVLVRLHSRGDGKNEAVISLEEKVVKQKKEPMVYKPVHEAAGTHTMNRNDLLRSPGAIQDISFNMQFLPGVMRTNDQMADLVVRGGNPDENAYLLEGIPVFSINHFENNSQQGGAIGNLNTYFVDNVKLHNGAFAARYPDKMSSVMEMSFKKGNTRAHSGMFTFDMAGAGGVVEGPAPGLPGGATYGVTARYSALDFLDAAGLIDFGGVPKYKNMHIKLNSSPGKHDFSLNILGAEDEISIRNTWRPVYETDSSAASYNRTTDTYQYTRNFISGLRWNFNPRERFKSSVYVSLNTRNRKVEETDVQEFSVGDSAFPRRMASDWLDHSEGARWLYGADGTWFRGAEWTIRTGLLHDYFRPEARQVSGESFVLADTSISYSALSSIHQSFFTLAGYGELMYQGKRWDFYLGGRTLYDEFMDAWCVQPRLSVKRYLGRHAFRYAAGLFSQSAAVQVIGVERLEADVLPKSIHNVLGWEAEFPAGLFASVELFDKENFDLIRTRRDTSGSRVRTIAENSGLRVSRGADIFLKKEFGRRYWATASYTYAWNRERRDERWDKLPLALAAKVLSGESPDEAEKRPEEKWEKYAYSIPHYFSGALGYDISRAYTGSIRYSTASGSPYTSRERDPETWTWIEGGAFSSRTDPYSRLDLRLDYRKSFSSTALAVFLEITNILGSSNMFVNGEYSLREGWGFFPVGGVMVSF